MNAFDLKDRIDSYLNLPSLNEIHWFNKFKQEKTELAKSKEQMILFRVEIDNLKKTIQDQLLEINELNDRLKIQDDSVKFDQEFNEINPIIQELIRNETKNGKRHEIKIFVSLFNLESL